MYPKLSEYSFKIDVPYWFYLFYDSLSKKEVFSQKTSDVIKISGKSREHVCRLFKSATDVTLGDFLNELRIEHASAMLTTTNYDIIDVALDSGFDNLSTFYHLFKKYKGLSPKRYRDLYGFI